MSVEPVIMPKLGAYMDDVVLSEWLVGEGEQVAPGRAIFELETAPANVDVGAYAADYVYTWKLPPRTFPGYDLVAMNGEARLYARTGHTR